MTILIYCKISFTNLWALFVTCWTFLSRPGWQHLNFLSRLRHFSLSYGIFTTLYSTKRDKFRPRTELFPPHRRVRVVSTHNAAMSAATYLLSRGRLRWSRICSESENVTRYSLMIMKDSRAGCFQTNKHNTHNHSHSHRTLYIDIWYMCVWVWALRVPT